MCIDQEERHAGRNPSIRLLFPWSSSAPAPDRTGRVHSSSHPIGRQSLPPPGTVAVGTAPNSWLVGGVMYPFSFMTVSGGLATMGPNVGEVVGLSSYNAMMPPPPVGIGNLPINVLYVFVPPGSPNGGGTPGATIDEFDQTTGQLIDDN